MAEAAISSLVQLLGNLLAEKVKFLGAVVGEVDWLKDELQRMQCFLRDAEEKQATNNSVSKWISDIRELAFDAEDVIQIFILNIENPRKSRGLLERCACFPNHVYHLDRVAEQIQSIRKRLEAIEQSRNVYGIIDLGHRETVDWTQIPDHVEWQRRLIPTQQDKDVVGLEKDVESLLEQAILDDRKPLSSATIVGLPGIGKSTLARMVYNHDDVVKRFDKRAWIVVSNEFLPSQIFKGLILELLEGSEERSKVLETIQHEEAPKLQEMLYHRLQGKRYFIVLDDVWEDAHWRSLANAFPANEEGSSLLITSRSRISTEYTRYTHSMKILGSDDSWKLFLSKALTDNPKGKCPEGLEKLGEKILEKCDGLPLAINAVASLLFKQGQSKNAWKKVLDGINSHLGRNGSLVFDILELSYQNLPPKLKPCFLSLSLFKEDAKIRAVKLKNIWIAQGLIPQEGEETAEVVATRYLDELINRHLIKVEHISPDDQIKYCQVHDLIHELAVTKAKEEMGLEMLHGEGSSQSLDKPRHRALYTSLTDDENSLNKHLRSLFVYTDVTATPSSYWKDFELLKLLDLEECVSLRELPEAIGALVGLTYLGLKNTAIKKLPRSFRKLKNLEVVELPDSTELPSSAWDFISLRHVDGLVWWEKVPRFTSTLKSIHRLKSLCIGLSNYEQLPKITSLCYLSIYVAFLIDSIKLFQSLDTLKNLVRLTLELELCQSIEGLGTLRHVTRLKINGHMNMIRWPAEFPPNLTHLTLRYHDLMGGAMTVFKKLPYLSYLHLSNICCGHDMSVPSDGFSKLEILRLTYSPSLRSIRVGEGTMPELKRVEIRGCSDLNTESLKEQLRSSIVVEIHN